MVGNKLELRPFYKMYVYLIMKNQYHYFIMYNLCHLYTKVTFAIMSLIFS